MFPDYWVHPRLTWRYLWSSRRHPKVQCSGGIPQRGCGYWVPSNKCFNSRVHDLVPLGKKLSKTDHIRKQQIGPSTEHVIWPIMHSTTWLTWRTLWHRCSQSHRSTSRRRKVAHAGTGPTLLWFSKPFVYILIFSGPRSALPGCPGISWPSCHARWPGSGCFFRLDSHLIRQGLGNQIRESIRIWSKIRWIQTWESVPEHKSVNFWMPLTLGQLA